MALVEKGNALRIPKIYRNLSRRYFFPSLRYFNFFKDVFKTEISKKDKNGKP